MRVERGNLRQIRTISKLHPCHFAYVTAMSPSNGFIDWNFPSDPGQQTLKERAIDGIGLTKPVTGERLSMRLLLKKRFPR